MEMTGERRIAAPRQVVWDALNDPAVLQASIPGCEAVERTGDDRFEARVAMRIGPMSIRFGGKVRLENLHAPERYSISGEGSGGAMGFAKGGADVVLEEDGPDATRLGYTARAQIGGKMAQLGARLIDSTAKQVSEQFFAAFAGQVERAHAENAPPMPLPALAPSGNVERAGPPPGPVPQSAAAPDTISSGRAGPGWGWIGYAAAAAVLAALAYALF